jgi:hypothetical protein
MKKLHLECKPDETLAKVLGKTKKEILHHNDKGRVCKYLSQNTGLTGMIDEDPNSAQPSYLEKLTDTTDKYQVKELSNAKTGNKMLVLCPRLEEWIIDVCQKNNVAISDFGLSDKPNTLHGEINSKLAKFEELLVYLLEEAKSKELLHLKSLLS